MSWSLVMCIFWSTEFYPVDMCVFYFYVYVLIFYAYVLTSSCMQAGNSLGFSSGEILYSSEAELNRK